MDMWLGQTALDLAPCHYGYSQLRFRGPAVELDEPYVAFLGGTETVAPMVQRPYCELVAEGLGLNCVNLGIKNAGPDVFLNEPELLRVANGAELVVLEVLGSANLSNRFYDVHPRRNDRFTRPHEALLELSKRLDLTDVHFTGHLHGEIERVDPKAHSAVVASCQKVWVERMHQLIASIERPVHLLRFAQRSANPCKAAFVEPTMVASLASAATGIVRVEPSEEALSEGTKRLM